MPSSVVISARGEQRIRSGHPWIYRTDVMEPDAEGGEIVAVIGPRNRVLGDALFSDRSQITLRMLSQGDGEVGLALIRARLERAIAFRLTLGIDASAYRLVHGEGDLLPSLVVDRYGDYLVMQTLSQGMDRLLPELVSMLIECLAPTGDPCAERPQGAGARRSGAEGRGCSRDRTGVRDGTRRAC